MLNIILHASGVACFGYSLYYDLVHVQVPVHLATSAAFASMRAFPGKWKYLTIWDMVLQFVYHSVSLVNDLCGSSELARKRQSALQKFRDGLFASWAFPVGLFVSITFWGLYAIDRALVFPKELDEFYPPWLNHAVHTGPITFMALELLTTPKLLPGRNISLVGNIGFSMTYLALVTWVHSQSGVWAYPVLEILNNAQRGIFFGSCCLSIVGLYFLGEKIGRWRWGVDDDDSDEKSTKARGSSGSGKGKRKSKLT